jgi:hypothetical protein
MKIGDLVRRTYGEGRRPTGIIVGWYKWGRPGALAQIRWLGGTRVEELGTKYLEILSEAG